MTLQATNGAIAVTRFGLGARPGELATASADPQGWLKAQIAASGGEQPQGPLPTGRAAFTAYMTALQEFRQIKRDAPATTPPDGAVSNGAPDDLKAQRKALLAPIRDGVRDEMVARTRLATATAQPFRERWTLFWANHFTVSAAKPKAAMLAGPSSARRSAPTCSAASRRCWSPPAPTRAC